MDPRQNVLAIRRYTTSAAAATTYSPHPEGIAVETRKIIAAVKTTIRIAPCNSPARITPITWLMSPTPKKTEASS